MPAPSYDRGPLNVQCFNELIKALYYLLFISPYHPIGRELELDHWLLKIIPYNIYISCHELIIDQKESIW